jgi:hypothetical protein
VPYNLKMKGAVGDANHHVPTEVAIEKKDGECQQKQVRKEQLGSCRGTRLACSGVSAPSAAPTTWYHLIRFQLFGGSSKTMENGGLVTALNCDPTMSSIESPRLILSARLTGSQLSYLGPNPPYCYTYISWNDSIVDEQHRISISPPRSG